MWSSNAGAAPANRMSWPGCSTATSRSLRYPPPPPRGNPPRQRRLVFPGRAVSHGAPENRMTARTGDTLPVAEMSILWLTAGLSCDGDTIAMTAATQPSLEDLLG